MSEWTPPSPLERKRILDSTRTIAVVGASSNPSRASNFVMTYLKSSVCDFELYPINPRETEIYGHRCYPSLADLPITPDLVDVFRRVEDCPGIAAEAVEVGATTLWLQLGLWSDEAAAIGHRAGLDVVMDRCTKIEHARFAGGLHLAGFDTGVISSHRRGLEDQPVGGSSRYTAPKSRLAEPRSNLGAASGDTYSLSPRANRSEQLREGDDEHGSRPGR